MIKKFINKIEMMPAAYLKDDLLRISADEVLLDIDSLAPEELAFRRPAQLTISDKVDDGNRLYTAKLTLMACKEWLGRFDRQVFLCTAVDGSRYLIGNERQPFPVVTQQQNHPDDYKGSQLTEVTVTWSTPLMVPRLITP